MSTREAQIKSDLQSIGEILKADFRYKVPLHQRNFTWTLEEVKQLWEDIIGAMNNGLSEYFMGTIVVQEDRDQKIRSIIDGQQRLATLVMIFSAIRTIYSKHRDDRADDVHKDYLGVKDRRSRMTESRLTLNAENEPVFQRLVIENIPDEELKREVGNKSQTPSNHLLIKAAHYIREEVWQRAQSPTKYESVLLEIEEYVRDNIVVILVRVGDEADAYLIFETLNDRGLDLSISDLLKNYIFSRAGQRLDIVRKQWQEMVVILGTQDQTQFLRHYWLSKYGVVRERELYREMKRKFSNTASALRLMSELREAVDKYSAITNVDNPLWKEYGSSLRKDIETLQIFGLSQFRPLLLAVLDTLNQREITKVIEMIVVLSMRFSIIGSLGTGNIERAYSDAALKVREKKADTVAKIFNVLKNIYPDDARFKADFSEKTITKPRIARYILTSVANKVHGTKMMAILENEKVVTLEHIMPKTKSQDWERAAKDEEEYYSYVDRLGNLTLLERDKNKAASNASFETKKNDAFSKSEIEITRQLTQYTGWTVPEITSRQQKLAETALKIWTLPYYP